jgi:drug/metabolite transporter (DMT)-like permease
MMKSSHDPRVAYLLVNLATLLWASNITLGRALHDQIGPATLAAIRFTIAAIFFILFRDKFIKDQSAITLHRQDWLILLGMGFTGIFAFPTLMYLALNFTTATNALLINGISPLATVLLSALLLREAIKLNLIIGTLTSLIGVGFVISNGSLAQLTSLNFNLGDMIVLFNVIIWGIYSILGRIATRRQSSLSATAYSIWFAIPFLVITSFFEWRQSPPIISTELIISVLYIGIFTSVFAYLAWVDSIRRAGPNQAMAFYNMLPVYGIILSMLFLGEEPTLYLFIGGALVVGGGLVVALGSSKRKNS